jgi:hypothetical protein
MDADANARNAASHTNELVASAAATAMRFGGIRRRQRELATICPVCVSSVM